MAEQLRDKVAKGVVWTASEKIGSMLLQFFVSIIIVRLLSPDDIGVMAILTFFTALSIVITDSGFSQTLIRKRSPSQDDYVSVFIFNVAVSFILYALLVGVSPFVASFYGVEEIRDIAPVLFLVIPVSSLGVIQNTIYSRQFCFGMISKINFTAALVSGVSAILLALNDFGVWSLVAQRLLQAFLRSAMMWIFTPEEPHGRYSSSALREMLPLSMNLMTTDFISSVYNNISQLFIGKIYSTTDLGFFNQGQKMKELPSVSIVQSVQSVTYPALSNVKDNVSKFSLSYYSVILVVSYVVTPLMVGMAVVADDFFYLLLGQKWMPTVPFFQILILGSVFYPLSQIAYNVLKVGGVGSYILRMEILRRVVMTLILLVTIPVSTKAVAVGLSLMMFLDYMINQVASLRYLKENLIYYLRPVVKSVIMSLMMGATVMAESPYLPVHSVMGFVVKIVTGVAVYILFSLLFRVSALKILTEQVKRIISGK